MSINSFTPIVQDATLTKGSSAVDLSSVCVAFQSCVHGAANQLAGRLNGVLLPAMRIFLLIAMFTFTSKAMGSELIRNLDAGKPQTVVFYGTSVSTGGWTNIVAAQLQEKYGGLVKPVFSGMSGNQSRDGIANLREKVLDLKPDTVFIEFAINDAHTRFGITPLESRENLLTIIKAVREQNANAEIILSTMNDVIDVKGKTPATDRPQLAEYYQGYRGVAAEQKCLLVDHFKNWRELREKDEAKFKSYLSDGLHPSAAAAGEFIAPVVLDALTRGVEGKPSIVLKQITTRTLAAQRPEDKKPGHDACTSRIQHIVTADATGLRLVYGTPAGIGYELRAAVDIRGTTYPLTFDGKTSVTVERGQYVISDPVEVAVAKGKAIHSRTYTVNSHEKHAGTWQQVIKLSAERGEWHGEGDLTATTEPQMLAHNDGTRGPLHILGKTSEKVNAVAFNGDSIASTVEFPWTVRIADKAGVAWSHATTGGDSILYQKQRRVACWPLGLGGFTHFVCALGANDLGRGEAILEKYVEHWTWAKKQGVKVYQVTVLPFTSSTDRFATLEGQTPKENEAFRVRINDWLRDGAPLRNGVPAIGTVDPSAVRIGHPDHPLDGYIETADAVESSRNSGKWRVDKGSIGGDGLHPNAKAHELIAESIPATIFH